MKKRNTVILTGVAGTMLAAFMVFLAGTMGGCGGGPSAGVTASILAGSQQNNPDNPIFPKAPTHPMRIAYLSDKDQSAGNHIIWAMNWDGSLKKIVAETKDATQTPVPFIPGEQEEGSDEPAKTRFTFHDPAISQNGQEVYYASDYFASSTNIVKTGITNTAQVNVTGKGYNLREPAVSWDGQTVAFVGYTSKEVTAVIRPEKQTVGDDGKALEEAESLIWLAGGGAKITTRLDSAQTDYGILMLDEQDVTECPAPGSLKEPNGPNSATNTYTYDNKVEFSTYKGRYAFLDDNQNDIYPLNKTICLNMDNTSFLIMEVTAYEYGYTKEAGYICSTTKDPHCGIAVFSDPEDPKDYVCTTQGLCLDSGGNFTTRICTEATAAADCGGNTCDVEKRCIMDTGVSASITFDWSWVKQTISGKAVTSVEEIVGDADPITVTDTLNSDGTRTGSGINLIQTLDFKRYDLYTADIDGSNVIRHTDDDIAERYPCFSPTSPDVVYYTHAEASVAYQDVEDPILSEIYKLDITASASGTVQPERVFETSALVKHCSFNPAGTKMAYSRDNGTDFDIYLYDLSDGTSSFLVNTTSWNTSGADDLWPSFSPNGNAIAFQSDETGDNDIFTADIIFTPEISATNIKNLTNNRNIEDISPAWSP